jgi:hypothetical protein
MHPKKEKNEKHNSILDLMDGTGSLHSTTDAAT